MDHLIFTPAEAKVVANTIRAMRSIEMQSNFEMHSLVCPEQMFAVLDAPSREIFITGIDRQTQNQFVERHKGLEAFEAIYGLVPTLTIA